MKVITIREPDTCRDCGRDLPAGSEVRYYSRDKLFCAPDCREATRDLAGKAVSSRAIADDQLMATARVAIHALAHVLQDAESWHQEHCDHGP